MKARGVFLSVIMSAGTVFPAVAASGGQITFEGLVLETPCSIDAGDLDQKVDFGIISKSQVNLGGQTPAKVFSIKLMDCEFATAGTATTTFNGQAGHDDTFGVSGQAKNVGVVLVSNGKRIAPGSNIQQPVQAGNNTLNFQAFVEGDPDTTKAVEVGDFTSVANFTIAYQ